MEPESTRYENIPVVLSSNLWHFNSCKTCFQNQEEARLKITMGKDWKSATEILFL